jgi:hypothetical protein
MCEVILQIFTFHLKVHLFVVIPVCQRRGSTKTPLVRCSPLEPSRVP